MTQIIDRRKSAGEKVGAESRRRFLKRYEGKVHDAAEKAVAGGNIGNIGRDGIEVEIDADELRQPHIRHGKGGTNTGVHPGNKEFSTGDRMRKKGGEGSGDGSGPGAGEAGNGEGGQRRVKFRLTEEEFLQHVFNDLELPNLIKPGGQLAHVTALRRDGYAATGPSNRLDLQKSFIRKQARTHAAEKPYNEKILENLREERAILAPDGPPERETGWRPQRVVIRELGEEVSSLKAAFAAALLPKDAARIAELDGEIAEAERLRACVPAWNKTTDLRYKHYQEKPDPDAKAVMFCLMDVSGSMSEERRNNAKLFYFLLHRFLKSNYQEVDVVFIAHDTKAREVDEQGFFDNQDYGGTMVSSATDLMQKIMKERYSGPEWNVYGAQASDGDNWSDDDNKVCAAHLRQILPQTQGYFYTEITDSRPQGLWHTYAKVQEEFKDRFWMGRVEKRADVVPLFRNLFKRKDQAPGQKPAAAFGPGP